MELGEFAQPFAATCCARLLAGCASGALLATSPAFATFTVTNTVGGTNSIVWQAGNTGTISLASALPLLNLNAAGNNLTIDARRPAARSRSAAPAPIVGSFADQGGGLGGTAGYYGGGGSGLSANGGNAADAAAGMNARAAQISLCETQSEPIRRERRDQEVLIASP